MAGSEESVRDIILELRTEIIVTPSEGRSWRTVGGGTSRATVGLRQLIIIVLSTMALC